MSTSYAPQPAGPTQAPPSGLPKAPKVSWHGIRTIAVLEVRQRIRSTRWKVALTAWFALVGIVTLLLIATMNATGIGKGASAAFGLLLLFVLGLGLMVAPTLSSTTINGDRNAGTLAILQVTLLSPADIALGKLLASWAAAIAFLVVTMPFLLWSAALGGADFLGLLRSVIVLALLLGVVCAIGLGFSALTTRTAGSSVLTYVSVLSLTVISLVLFGLTIPAVTTTDDVRVYGYVQTSTSSECAWSTEERSQVHTERTWWLLAINPFVILADASPEVTEDDDWSLSALGSIRAGVNLAREGATGEVIECWNAIDDSTDPDDPSSNDDPLAEQAPIWPWGLGLNLLLGVGATALAIRQLRVPYGTLARGTRVA